MATNLPLKNENWRTINDALQSHAENNPDGIAYRFLENGEEETSSITYAALYGRAQSISRCLSRKAKKGDRALLLYPSGIEYIEAFLACLMAGIIAVPAYPPTGKKKLGRLENIIADCQPALLLCQQHLFNKCYSWFDANGTAAHMHWVTTDTLEEELPGENTVVVPEDIAFLQYTSGSTGDPKGVMVTHANMMHNQQLLKSYFKHDQSSIGVGWLPMYHDMGLIGYVLQPLYCGFTSVLMPPSAFIQRPVRWLQAISHYKATTSGGPNFSYDLCVSAVRKEEIAGLDLGSWDAAFNGAEPIKSNTLHNFAAAFSEYGFKPSSFMPCYGMAETTLIVTGVDKYAIPGVLNIQNKPVRSGVAEINAEEDAATVKGGIDVVSCGPVLRGMEVSIVDPVERKLCGERRIGEIWVKGDSVAGGYWQRSAKTTEIFSAYTIPGNGEGPDGQGPFLRTGDTGFLHEGQLYVTGRLKEMLIFNGANYYPKDIELTVQQAQKDLQENAGAAFSVEIDGAERLIIAQEIKRTSLHSYHPEELVRLICREVMQSHELPVHELLLIGPGRIPKTSSGKIQRIQCREWYLNDTFDGVIYRWKTSGVSADAAPERPVAPLPFPKGRQEIAHWLLESLSTTLNIPLSAVKTDTPFAELGLSSVQAIQLTGQLTGLCGRHLAPTLIYDYPDIDSLSRFLSGIDQPDNGQDNAPARIDSAKYDTQVAIIGISCRFPGADSPEEFWENLLAGKDCISGIPPDRWDIEDYYSSVAAKGKMNTRWGGFLKQVDCFDAGFFGISASESGQMDPQQRILLELTHELIERAGYDAAGLKGTDTGVYLGISQSNYADLIKQSVQNVYSGWGGALSIAANRLSYYYDFKGPSMAIDTACSSSLVGLHLAVQSIQKGECVLAIAGGINLILTPEVSIALSQANMMADDGKCKTFDASANGYVRSEGAGLVLLKSLSRALQDGDKILAVVKGTAVNQDGHSNGLSAPNGLAQQAVIRAALRASSVRAAAIGYVETHGTGTSLGDPIEVNALNTVYETERNSDSPLIIGAVKANIGHLEAAAGIAGLIKTVLCLLNDRIPAQIHCKTPNPHIDWQGFKIKIPFNVLSWPRAKESVRMAGVSSFGFGGVNAHVIIEEPPLVDPAAQLPRLPYRAAQLVAISGRGAAALEARLDDLLSWLEADPSVQLEEIAYSSGITRHHFGERAAIIATTRQELIAKLRKKELIRGSAAEPGKDVLKTAFLFTGQGSQYPGMGKALYETEPVFKRSMEECARLFKEYLELDLLEVIFAAPASPAASCLDQTKYTQPALFSLEYSLSRLWDSWGVRPDVLMGHSIGELTAACISGIFSLADGIKLVAYRAILMQQLAGGGSMASLDTGLDKALTAIKGYESSVSIAAVNSPLQTVISGESGALQAICQSLEKQGIRATLIGVSHAFHSPLMQPVLESFQAIANTIDFHPPQIPLISNVTGRLMTGEWSDPSYWVGHIMATVDFVSGMRTAESLGVNAWIELGPDPVLMGMGARCVQDAGRMIWLPSLRKRKEDQAMLLSSAGRWYASGGRFDWKGFYKDRESASIFLPVYPFQRQRYWVEHTGRKADDPSRLLYQTVWEYKDKLAHDFRVADANEGWLMVEGDPFMARRAADLLNGSHKKIIRFAVTDVLSGHDTSEKSVEALISERIGRCFSEFQQAGAAVIKVVFFCDDRIQDYCFSWLLAVRNIHKWSVSANKTAAVYFVTKAAMSIGDKDPLSSPYQAMVWAMGRVFSLEHPGIWGGMLDMTAGPDDAQLHTLLALLSTGTKEDHIAIRSTGVFVQRVRRLSRTARKGINWKVSGTALITGGLGALGLNTARWLLTKGVPDIVLLGRSSASDKRATELIREFSLLGCRLKIVQADVCDKQQMAQILSGIESLKMVFHAAGRTANESLAGLTAPSFHGVLAPKVTGTDVLAALTEELDLDAFVCYSSIAAVWGSGMQTSYAMGNAYMDAKMAAMRQTGRAAYAINWGPWAGGGMIGAKEEEQLEIRGIHLIGSNHALDALQLMLEEKIGRLIVASIDWPLFRKLYATVGDRPLLDKMEGGETPPKIDSPGTGNRFAASLGSLAPHLQKKLLTEWLQARLAEILQIPDKDAINIQAGLFDLGLDSLMAVQLSRLIQSELELAVPATIAVTIPNISSLADHLLKELKTGAPSNFLTGAPSGQGAGNAEPVAIIGAACRLPGGINDLDSLWALLKEEKETVREIPGSRWNVLQHYDPDPGAAGKMYTRYGSFIDAPDEFDAAFFGLSPREARKIDPQHRLLLETCWESLETAGITKPVLKDSTTGVFIGIGPSDYERIQNNTNPNTLDAYNVTGTHTSFSAGRISYLLGVNGPSLAVDTACSSSLVALHLACKSLQAGECERALVGGVQLMLDPIGFIGLSRTHALSADGRCKSFSNDADGYGRGEGCIVLTLQRLSDARRDGVNILGLIRGSAINHDGASSGLTVPSGRAQELVINNALKNAGVGPEAISYVEAHGTGTQLGDPIEILSLEAVYGKAHAGTHIPIGTIKSNIGHLESAAGLAGILKVLASLESCLLPKSLHSENLSRHIAWNNLSVSVLQQPLAWPRTTRPRMAGVSAFGLSGTNAHVIVEEAPALQYALPGPERIVPRKRQLVVLSGLNPEALIASANNLLKYLERHPETLLEDMAYSLATTRTHFPNRIVFSVTTKEALMTDLRNLPERIKLPVRKKGKTAFLFTGQGSQYAGMAKGLYEKEPAFKAAFDQCAGLFAPLLPVDLVKVIFGMPEDGSLIDATGYTQPALFVVEYALCRLWQDWGVEPDVLIGHSLGEITAACIAGVFTLKEAVSLVACRSSLMQALPGNGAMAVVQAATDLVQAEVHGYETLVSVAAINTPGQVVLSGRADALEAVLEALAARGIKSRYLKVSHAFHSPLMSPMLEPFRREIEAIDFQAPCYTLISNLSGQPAQQEIRSADYWVEQVRSTVLFLKGVSAMEALGVANWLEIGPDPVLINMASDGVKDPVTPCWLASLRKGKVEEDTLLLSLGELYERGADIDWQAFYKHREGKKIALFTYAFVRQKHWIDNPVLPAFKSPLFEAGKGNYPLEGVKLKSPDKQQAHYALDLSRSAHAYVYHHVVYGQPVVAGAFYIGVMLAIGAGHYQTEKLTLLNIEFYRPLFLKDFQTVHTILKQVNGNQCEVSIYTQNDDEWTLHCKGVVTSETPPAGTSRELEPTRASYVEEADPGALYDDLKAMLKIDWLEKWRWTAVSFSGKDGSLNRLVAAEGENYTESPIHPILIDNAFGGGAALVSKELLLSDNSSVIPFGVESFTVLKPVTGPVWSEFKIRRESISSQVTVSDIFLWNEEAELVAEIKGFISKSAPKELFLAPTVDSYTGKDWIYKTGWSPVTVGVPAPTPSDGKWLICSSGVNSDEADLLAREFSWLGLSVITSTDLDRWLKETDSRDVAGIVVLWNENNPPDRIGDAKKNVLSGLSQLQKITAWLSIENSKDFKGIWWVMEKATDSPGRPAARPGLPANLTLSGLKGLGRVFMQENPDIPLTLIEQVRSEKGLPYKNLAKAMLSGTNENQLLVSEDGFFGWRLSKELLFRQAVPGSANLFPQTECTVLITGGLTGIGLETARHLSGAYQLRHLILLGRSDPGPQVSKVLRELESSGTLITVVKADVSDRALLKKVIDEIPAGYPLKGIIHAAGLIDDGLISEQNADRFDKVMKPKVDGAWHLHELSADLALDFFVLFSSAVSLLGSAGQSNYAAANAFLDGLTDYRLQMSLPVHTINWGPWASVGLAEKLGSSARLRMERQGINRIDVESGIRLLFDTLANPPGKYAILPIDLIKAGAFYENAGRSIPVFLQELIRISPKNEPGPSPDIIGQLKSLSYPLRVAAIAKFIQKEVAKILNIEDFTKISLEQSLLEQGLDSLMAVELKNNLTKMIGKPLPITLLFENPLIGNLSELLLSDYLDFSNGASADGRPASVPIQPVEPADRIAPLSSMQSRLWFIQQTIDVPQLFNLYYELNYQGDFSLATLQVSLFSLIQRHEALRSKIVAADDGDSVVVIGDAWLPELGFVDVSEAGGDRKDSELQSFRYRRMNTHFDFRGVSILFDVIKWSKDTCKLAITQSHLFSDGWSCIILLREIMEIYNAFEAGRSYSLDAPGFRYADFSKWENKRMAAGDFGESKSYWRQQLKGLPSLSLPVDFPYPAVKTFKGAHQRFEIAPDQTKLLLDLARKEGVTLSVLLVSAYSVLIQGLTGQNDFAVGTVNANRNLDGMERTVGFFANTVVLRFDLSGDPAFPDYLQRVKKVMLESIRHHEIPFSEVVNSVEVDRRLDKTPLYNVSFMLESFYFAKNNETDNARWSFDLPKADAGIEGRTGDDLGLVMSEYGGRLVCDLNYNTDIFSGGSIGKMVSDFQTILDLILSNPGKRISFLPFNLREINNSKSLEEFIATLNKSGSGAENILEF